jgi:ABC-2 type transport system permease protein
VPREQLSGWLDTVATFNPVTYLLEGLRSLVVEGWEWGTSPVRLWRSASSLR